MWRCQVVEPGERARQVVRDRTIRPAADDLRQRFQLAAVAIAGHAQIRSECCLEETDPGVSRLWPGDRAAQLLAASLALDLNRHCAVLALPSRGALARARDCRQAPALRRSPMAEVLGPTPAVLAGSEARKTACEAGSAPMRRRRNGSRVSAPMKRSVLGRVDDAEQPPDREAGAQLEPWREVGSRRAIDSDLAALVAPARRTSRAPRSGSRSVSLSASASLIRRPARQSTTITPRSVHRRDHPQRRASPR